MTLSSKSDDAEEELIEVFEFDDDDVDRAIDFVAEHGAKDRGQTISYSRVLKAAGLPAPRDLYEIEGPGPLSRFMERFHYRCKERSLPPLDALVVHVDGSRRNLPGSGYFRVNGLRDPLRESTSAADADYGIRYLEDEQHLCAAWGRTERRRR